MGSKLHPQVEEFKAFVKNHPSLIQEVRNGKQTWQELFEDWYLLGEDDEKWKQYNDSKGETATDSKSDFIGKIFSNFKNVNINDVQQQITNVGSAISTIQNVIQQFQGFKKPNHPQSSQSQYHPFAFRKD